MALLTDPVTNGVTVVPSDYWGKVSRLLNTSAFYNVRNQDFGATGNGTTDDTAAIQACINATSAGDTIIFPPGTYLVSAPIVRKPNRHYIGLGGGWNGMVVLKVKDGSSANFTNASGTSGVFVPESWDTNATVASGPVTIMNIAVNGNRANNATGQHAGFILGHGEYWSHYENLYAYENRKAGFHFTPLGKNGSSLMAAGVSDIRVRDFLATQNTGDGVKSVKSGGVFLSDVVCDGNNLMFFNDGSGWIVDEAANWRIDNLHMWMNGKHGIYFVDSGYASRLSHIYVEDFGRLGISGEFLSGVATKTFNGRSPTLHDCTVGVNTPVSGVTHYGITVEANDTDAHAWVHDNEVMAQGTVNNDMWGFNFFAGDSGKKLSIHGTANNPRGFNAGRSFNFGGNGGHTHVFDPPMPFTATTIWDPASIANGASATTTITVAGASVGDPAFASLSTLTTAGNILITARVTAADTVSVTIHNDSGAAVDPASGTLRATVWKH